MNETVREWLAKAEADYATAQREIMVTTSPNFDAVCFHAQQCIEKLMKAILIRDGVVPARTHDLVPLSAALTSLHPGWFWPPIDLRFLTRAAVAFRYPGESADREDAIQSFDIATRLRVDLRPLLQRTPE